MKHTIPLHVVTICLAALLIGCAHSEVPATQTSEAPLLAENTVAAVTEPIAISLPSQEQAMIEGYVVMQDGDVHHNQHIWDAFWENVVNSPASVKLAHFTFQESRSTCTVYDLHYTGTDYQLTITDDSGSRTETFLYALKVTGGSLDENQKPYNRWIQYYLTNTELEIDDFSIMIYQDLIADPDYSGVSQINLHLKEGEPPLKVFSEEAAVASILNLLSDAEYVNPPVEYLYGVKLIMVNKYGQELVLEIDLNNGVFRYGMQHYRYGEIANLFTVLGLSQWPEDVLVEYQDLLA